MIEEMKQLNDKIDYLTKLMETILKEDKKRKKKPKMDVLTMLNSSAFSKHPSFKRVIDKMKESL